MTNELAVGSLVRLQATFKNVDGAPTDPTTVTLKITLPNGTIALYTYGQDNEVVKDSTGMFHMDFSCDIPGFTKHRWIGTGSVQAAARKEFRVMPE